MTFLYDILPRIKDLFTKIPIEELNEVQFHFAHAQYWIFFGLAYLGFALVTAKKIGQYLNIIYVGVLSYFILAYNGESDGLVFWLVFAFGYLAYALIYDYKKTRSAYLLFFSLFFYWRVGAPFVWILLVSTVVDFFLGKAIYASSSSLKKKSYLALSVVVNLAMLGYFKYFKFFAENWNAMISQHDWSSSMLISHPHENAIGIWLNGQFTGDLFMDALPMIVGISFYTFQSMSYSLDIYRGQLKPLKNIVDFGFFVSFFPQLVAGPIVRASEFVPQIHKEFKLSKADFGWAVYMILKGLIKKMVFADFIAAYFLDDVFASPGDFSGMAQVIAIFGYSLQIYGDFSGYTDMAIGIAKLMGFQLPTNFNSPYKAIHCGEFWKRWHITLSRWLKDYLYIPLGGNRGGSKGTYIVSGLIIAGVLYAVDNGRVTIVVIGLILIAYLLAWYFESFKSHINRNINITLTMLIGGLWHGASWQFVIWGGLNGLGVLTAKYWLKFKNYHKVFFALMLAGGLLLIKIITGNPIWLVGMWWALVVSGISFIKVLYDFSGKSKWSFYYVNVMWGMVHTLFFITFTRVYFRGETMGKINIFYHQLMTDFRWDFSEKWLFAVDKTKDFVEYSSWVFIVMIIGYLVHWLPNVYKKKIENGFINTPVGIQLVLTVLIVVICYQTYSADAPAFIYFQF